ncbi:MAG: hypothetical protein JNG86_00560 [Verrucomicrobiaceae bacterium]|nr:hypothetical protein [Verrucomicrobiaceae bacterium]
MPVRLRLLAFIAATAALARGEEPLPLPSSLVPVTPLPGTASPVVPTGFIKPTKSIKPPAAAPQFSSTGAPAPAPVQIVSSPAPDTRLRRLVVVDARMEPEAIRSMIIASSQGRVPVTMAGGVTAPAPVLSDLAGLFGSTANEDTQKKVLDTVKKGMGSSAKALKRAEIVGWVPSEGVMAIAVYPES